jgi:hypothetical protein
MSLKSVKHQKSAQAGLPLEGEGEAESFQRSGETPTAANGNERSGNDYLMERVVERSNAKAALKRVRQNKGGPGTDGMTVDELPTYLVNHWEAIRAQLLDGTYQPKPVRRQEIPKSGGGVRTSSSPSCRCFNRGSTRPFRSTATASDLGAAHIKRCVRRRGTSSQGSEWW